MMIPAQNTDLEEKRLEALDSYNILNTVFEKDFDDIVLLISEICNTPIALISFISQDKQWFKSVVGLNVRETSREISFCAHAIDTPEKLFIVEDATKDERFFDNPLVLNHPNVIFYAGIPLLTTKGFPLGTLCVIDQKPRKLSNTQIKALKVLSNQVTNLLELRTKNIELKKNKTLLTNKNTALEKFTQSAINTISDPINTIDLLLEIINKNKANNFTKKNINYIQMIKKSSEKMVDLIHDIKEYHKNLDIIVCQHEKVFVNDLLDEITKDSNFDTSQISFEKTTNKIFANKLALKVIISKILSYSAKTNVNSDVIFQDTKLDYTFLIKSDTNYNANFISEIKSLVINVDGTLSYSKKNLSLTFKKS